MESSNPNANISADTENDNTSDKINTTANVMDNDGNHTLNGATTLIIDGVKYNAEVFNHTATFRDIIIAGDINNTTEPEKNRTEPSNKTQNDVNRFINSNQTGSLLLISLLLLTCLISIHILRRER